MLNFMESFSGAMRDAGHIKPSGGGLASDMFVGIYRGNEYWRGHPKDRLRSAIRDHLAATDAGARRHQAAVPVAALPFNIAIEIEAEVLLR
jgi:hypothetical protein